MPKELTVKPIAFKTKTAVDANPYANSSYSVAPKLLKSQAKSSRNSSQNRYPVYTDIHDFIKQTQNKEAVLTA